MIIHDWLEKNIFEPYPKLSTPNVQLRIKLRRPYPGPNDATGRLTFNSRSAVTGTPMLVSLHVWGNIYRPTRNDDLIFFDGVVEKYITINNLELDFGGVEKPDVNSIVWLKGDYQFLSNIHEMAFLDHVFETHPYLKD